LFFPSLPLHKQAAFLLCFLWHEAVPLYTLCPSEASLLSFVFAYRVKLTVRAGGYFRLPVFRLYVALRERACYRYELILSIIFKLFDGTIHYLDPKRNHSEYGNWRIEYGIDEREYPIATYYQLPFSNLVNEQYRNFIAVGRMIHADIGSFGALRVMVNLNQLGEAAGVAAYISRHQNKSLQELDGIHVRNHLRNGGSAL
jgi:hypothetical protein